MAFAMQVAAGQKALTDCPEISDDAKTSLSEASAPPMKLVKVGEFESGQETVLFRHDEKFHRPTGLAIKIGAGLSDDEAVAKIETVNKIKFERVGAVLEPKLIAVEVDGIAAADRAKLAADKSEKAIVLVGKDAAKLGEAAEAIKDKKPLIYFAEASNLDELVKVAASAKVPLALAGSSLDELAEMTQKAKKAGADDLFLAFKNDKWGDTMRALTQTRRAALKHKFRELGYPTICEFTTGSSEEETVIAASAAAKYAGIVIIDGCEAWELLPILTVIQDVYTDPQTPNTVEAKLYAIGEVNENSPVMFTSNFSLTYFSVAGEVERSKVPSYICVVDTEGLGVLNAWAGDKISSEKIVKAMADQAIADKVKHRKLIIPGLLPMFRAEIEDISEWKEVIIGPETAKEIPAFMANLSL
jgi:acetyl-CoA decarbonylase/synthase complex subunit gamma